MKTLALLVTFTVLFGLGVQAEILDEQTEQTCFPEKGECVWTQYQRKKFHLFEEEWKTFEEFLSNPQLKENYDIELNYLDGTQVSLIPFVETTERIDLKDFPNSGALNWNPEISKERDSGKFTVSFNKIEGLNSIGFRIETNREVKFIDHDYLLSGLWVNEPQPVFKATDLLVGETIVLSFIDLIEAGFAIEFNKESMELRIGLSNKTGLVSADPTLTVYSDAADGLCIVLNNPPWQCSSCASIGTTSSLGYINNVGGLPDAQHFAFVTFNTSSIPDDATVTDADVWMYSHSISQVGCMLIFGIDAQYYYGENRIGATLDCSDYTGSWTSDSSIVWGIFTNAWKKNDVSNSNVSLTGDSDWKLDPLWSCAVAGDKLLHNWRSSRYAGTSTDPRMIVVYTVPVVEEEEEIPYPIQEELFWDDDPSPVWIIGLIIGCIVFFGGLKL